jgi:hypothetical protein
MKPPEKLKSTPLVICGNGLNTGTGSSPLRKLATPPRRNIASESRIVRLPTRSRTASIFLLSANAFI